MYAKWMRAPSGYYIGVIEFNNGHYYSHGRTADHLETNLKFHMYQKCRISQSQVHLEQSPSESIDLQYAHPKFISAYVKPKANKGTNEPVIIKNKIVQPPKMELEHISEIDKNTGELVIYELKEIARYKMRKQEEIKEEKKTIIPTPLMPMEFNNKE